MISFMTWRDALESVSELWSQLSQTNVTEDEGWTFFGTNDHFLHSVQKTKIRRYLLHHKNMSGMSLDPVFFLVVMSS